MHWKSTELLQKSFTVLKQICFFFFLYLNKHRQFLYFHNKINIPIKLTAHPTACHSDGERANISVIYTDMSNINPGEKLKVCSSVQLNSCYFFRELDFLQKFLYDSWTLSWITSQRTPQKHNLEEKLFIGLGWQGLGRRKNLILFTKKKNILKWEDLFGQVKLNTQTD